MKRSTVLTLALLVFSQVGLAGGSVEWAADALPLLKSHPGLLKTTTSSFDVSKTGGGMRLGRDFGADQGKRIPPFEFEAKLKGSPGDFNLLLIIHDPSGASDEGDVDTWFEVRSLRN